MNRLRRNEPIELEAGARVMYTAAFCRVLGFTGGDRRGTVQGESWQGKGYVNVLWDDDPSAPVSISTTALCRAGEMSPRACEGS